MGNVFSVKDTDQTNRERGLRETKIRWILKKIFKDHKKMTTK